MKVLLLICICLSSVFATDGIDFIHSRTHLSQAIFDCIYKESGKKFLISQIWEGKYKLNPNFGGNYDRAKIAGFRDLDVAAYICNNCNDNDPLTISSSIKNALPSGFNGRVWVAIEDCSNCWKGSAAQRLAYVNEVGLSLMTKSLRVGIYSSKKEWANVFGSADFDGKGLKGYPIWYSNSDNDKSFSDWKDNRFGGFGVSSMKQYKKASSFCAGNWNLDYKY